MKDHKPLSTDAAKLAELAERLVAHHSTGEYLVDVADALNMTLSRLHSVGEELARVGIIQIERLDCDDRGARVRYHDLVDPARMDAAQQLKSDDADGC